MKKSKVIKNIEFKGYISTFDNLIKFISYCHDTTKNILYPPFDFGKKVLSNYQIGLYRLESQYV